MKIYDVAVIGAGPAGYTCAIECAKLNKKTVIIEKDKLGGTCLNRGCIPTKFLWQAAKNKQKISKSQDYGIAVSSCTLNFADLIAKKNRLADNLSKGIKRLLDVAGVEIISGTASFKDSKHIVVDTVEGQQEIEATSIVISAGSECKSVGDIQFDHNKFISSTDVLNLTEIPKSMLVIGAGAIGIEMSSIFSCLGTEITLREVCPQILPSEDAELATELAKVMARQGIKVETNCKDAFADVDKFEKVLIVTGRKSVSQDLKLENAGVKVDNKNFVVTENYKTNIENIYAAGDISGKNFLAYTAEQDGINIAHLIAENISRNTQSHPIPKAVFSFPPSASVKATDFDSYKNVLFGKASFLSNARAQIEQERTGWVKVAVDADTKKIIGAWIIGANSDELINIVSVMIRAGTQIEDLSKNMFFHPGLAELIFEAIKSIKF